MTQSSKPFGPWEMPYYVTEKGDSWTGNMARDLEEALARHALTPGIGKHLIIIRAMNEVLPVNRVNDPDVDRLSREQRHFVETCRKLNNEKRRGYDPEWLELVDQLAPCPREKTNDELADIIRASASADVAARNALDELLNRINKK